MDKVNKKKVAMHDPSRRKFFTQAAAAGGAAGVGLGFSHGAVKAGNVGGRRKTLVYLFLRGGMDGLSFLVPTSAGAFSSAYQLNRDATRIPDPIGLTPNWGMHPFCGELNDLWLSGNLGLIHMCGHKDPDTYTRSHFDAQEQIELGTPGSQAANTGWLSRYLSTATDAPASPLFTAMVSGGNPPTSVNGWPDVATIDSTNGFTPNSGTYEDAHLNVLARMYQGTGALDDAVSTAMQAIETINNLDLDDYTPAGNVSYPNSGIGNDLKLAASVIRQDLGVGVITADLGGWDTHNTQNVLTNGYGTRIEDLTNSIAAFYKDMVAANYDEDVTVIVQSEFGRQVKENENRGTDHGLGNVMMVLGPTSRINGGLWGAFPGFDNTPGNAFVPTTDFRDVMISVTHGVLGNPAFGGGQSSIFPGHNYAPIPGFLRNNL
ncbi:MAG: DUF1501 domain-containing protein [Lysobacterales bacterium]